MGNELLDLQRLGFSRVALQRDGFLRTVGDADAAAHAVSDVYGGAVPVHREGRKLAELGAGAAGCAQVGVDLGDIAGRSQHRRAVLVGLHGTAAARAAIADGVEPAQHRIFEKGMTDVAALLLCAENLHCFALTDPTGASRVVFNHKAGKGLTDDEANVEGLAGIRSRGATGALKHDDVIRVLEHNVAGQGVGDYVFQVGQGDVFFHGDQL